MKKYVENVEKYVENVGNYVRILCEKYEEICVNM